MSVQWGFVYLHLWAGGSLYFLWQIFSGALPVKIYEFWKNSPMRYLVIPPFINTKEQFATYIKAIGLLGMVIFGIVYSLVLKRLLA